MYYHNTYDETSTILIWIVIIILLLGFFVYKLDRWVNFPYDDGFYDSGTSYTPNPKKSLPKKGDEVKESSYKSPPVNEIRYGPNMKIRVFSDKAKSLESEGDETEE